MVLFQNKEGGEEDLGRAPQELIGRLGLYRESPFRMIVRILDAGVTHNAETGDARLVVRFETVAVHCRGKQDVSSLIGRQSTVSSLVPPAFYGGMWSIEPLHALTIEDAIEEAERSMDSDSLVWQR